MAIILTPPASKSSSTNSSPVQNTKQPHISIHVGPYVQAVAALERQRHALDQQIHLAVQSCTPGWEDTTLETITVEPLSGAMTNFVFFVSKPNGLNPKVLLRVYGEGTDMFFPREQEMEIFKLLSLQNIGIGFLGEYANGRVETVIEGRPCNASDLRVATTSASIAQRMQQLHALELPIVDQKPTIMVKIHEFYQKVTENCIGPAFTAAFDPAQVKADIDRLQTLLEAVPSKIVFCHGDTQYGNVMLTKDGTRLIDFEYSGYNGRGFDIGNHFSEWAFNYHGDEPHLGDFSKYPTLEQQRLFCRSYLQAEANDQSAVIADEMVEGLRLEANTYAQASHLFWALWGMIQATQSEIDFDYLGYGMCRLNAFRTQQGL